MSQDAIVIGVILFAIGFVYLQNVQTEIDGLKAVVEKISFRLDQLPSYSSPPDTAKLPSEPTDNQNNANPIAIISGNKVKPGDPAHLMHIHAVFERLGYTTYLGIDSFLDSGKTDFDVLWNHEYSFLNVKLKPLIENPKAHQLINHIPGSGYYTSKVSLATANISLGVPKAFALPSKKDAFEAYANANPDLKWVQKSNAHRGIKVVPKEQLDLTQKDTFVQHFVENPLLVDGRKFDIGIYTVITSISPLRVYIYDGDVLLRFCAKDYEPFDVEDVDKYVVGDDYTPLWEMPSLKDDFLINDYTFKESLDAHLRERDINPEQIWDQVREIIRQVFEAQNPFMIKSAEKYKNKRAYFELSRFDFVVDTNLKVYLMEANMSPNLSSGHFAQNKALYEQVIFNIFSMLGLAKRIHGIPSTTGDGYSMQVSNKDVHVNFDFCNDATQCPGNENCLLCATSMTPEWRFILKQTFLEQISRRQMRRILPRGDLTFSAPATHADYLLGLWLDAKCHQNRVFCE
uniref:Tubulin polyglutamylase TTLL6 n=1 Tax=Panagrellus redivivus TaxID=6233 RepID=A0A7E4ZVL4_PANRE